jgi:hypothetical protein
MRPQPLDYGPQPRTKSRRLARRLLGAIGLVLVCAWSIRFGLEKFYYLNRDSVQSALAAIPGGRVLDVSGFDDGIRFTVANAEVSIDGSLMRTISFRSPRSGELQSGSRMCVTGLGPYSVFVEVGDQRILVQHLDFGRDSEFRDVLPFQLRDVKDLAAHFDKITAFVTQEPSGTYTTPEGKACRYRIRVSR